MKRFYICLGILAAIIGVCTWSFCLFSETQRDMVEKLDAIMEAAIGREEKKTVARMCEEYSSEWRKKEKILLRLVRHPQLDEISSLTAELRYLAEDDSYSHLLAAIERIKINLDKIGGAELFGG